jgi:hypothetical protein
MIDGRHGEVAAEDVEIVLAGDAVVEVGSDAQRTVARDIEIGVVGGQAEDGIRTRHMISDMYIRLQISLEIVANGERTLFVDNVFQLESVGLKCLFSPHSTLPDPSRYTIPDFCGVEVPRPLRALIVTLRKMLASAAIKAPLRLNFSLTLSIFTGRTRMADVTNSCAQTPVIFCNAPRQALEADTIGIIDGKASGFSFQVARDVCC